MREVTLKGTNYSSHLDFLKGNFTPSPYQANAEKDSLWNELAAVIHTTKNTLQELQSIIATVNSLSIVRENNFFVGSTLSTELTQYIVALDNARTQLLNDRFLVGVFGEFSAGKSTFINALTEHRFLKESTTSGTTCVPTYLEYADHEDAVILYADKSVERAGDVGEAKLRDFIISATADEYRGRAIEKVVWKSPVEVLKRGLTIVDTPGIATAEERTKRHTDLACSVAKQCDVLLVLTMLSSPLSEELLDSVRTVAGETAEHCIFVGTRADQLSEKERKRQAKFFDARLRSVFGSAKLFYFVSAYEALQELESESDAHAALDEFRLFRQKLFDFLHSQRQFIQCDTVSTQITALLQELDRQVTKGQELFQSKIDAFKQKALRADAPFWQEMRQQVRADLRRKVQEIQQHAREKVRELLDTLESTACACVRRCEDMSELKEYLSNGMNSTIRTFNDRLQQMIEREVSQKTISAAQSLASACKSVITERYRELESIMGKVSFEDIDDHVESGRGIVLQRADNTALVKDFESEENWKIGGGLATGIGVSLMISGGWVVAGVLALLGSAIGSIFLNMDKKKSEACDKVSQYVNSLRPNVVSQLDTMEQQVFEVTDKRLGEIIDQQQEAYLRTVDGYNKKIRHTTYLLDAVNQLLIDDCRTRLLDCGRQIEPLKQRIAANLQF
ncbi:MAG: dynamin family protein [Desulfovibrionaceae bacterium]|nr:dynamin family protein [Desulfovibrionaceae bacterium]